MTDATDARGRQPATSSSGTSRTHLDDALKQIWESNKAGVREQIAVIEQAVSAAVAGELGDDLRELARREAHKLAGSIGTLGFAVCSKRARELELGLAAGAPGPAEVARFVDAVHACRQELFGAEDTAELEPEPASAPLRVKAGVERGDAEPMELLIVDDDGPRARQIIAAAETRGLTSALAGNLASARRLLRRRTPTIVLLDLALAEGVDAALQFLTEASHDRPVLVVTDPGRSVDRVEVARRGGRGFLPHSLTASATIDAVISLRQRLRPVGTRVLAVDDDPLMLAALEAALAGTGLELLSCGDPARFWTALEEHEPDLVILDFDMPSITGPELCRALRNDQRWAGMPVLFLTSRGSAASIQEMFDAGADDYVRKPFVGPELLARIFNRLERVRLYRTLADVDALTGAFNRRKSVEDIARLLRMAARAGQPLSLSILDIDNFKAINDRHGHPAGDGALRGVGAALHRFLRGDDVIARWGGDEFVIAMYGMSADDGRQRIGDFLEGIRGTRFDPGGAVPVTMSAGLAEYPSDGLDLESLYRVADEALYVAKEEGRDRVVHRASRRPDGPDVLLVEDDLLVGRSIEDALHTRGYRTRWITDPEAAACALAPGVAIPAPVLLLGGSPPELGAERLLARAGAETVGRCRVIVLTRDAQDPRIARAAPGPKVARALALGALECLGAPLDVSALLRLIRRLTTDPAEGPLAADPNRQRTPSHRAGEHAAPDRVIAGAGDA